MQPLALGFQPAALPSDAGNHHRRHLLPRAEDVGQELIAVRRRNFRRCRRGGRTAVGHVVGNGVVGLVAYAGHHGDTGGEYGPRHGLGVETPQIFQRPSAPRHDDDVGQPFIVQVCDGSGDLFGGSVALNCRRRQTEFGQRIPPAHHVLDVLPNRAAGRGHHADNAGEQRERTLAGGIEQSLGLQLLSQPRQFQGQGAGADGQHRRDLHIGLSGGRIEGEVPAGQYLLPLSQIFLAGAAAEHDAANAAAILPQAEVGMAGGHRPQVGDLALYRQARQQAVRLKLVLEVDGHLADRVDYRRQHGRSTSSAYRADPTRPVRNRCRCGCPRERGCPG